jgi:hypothetical protein
VQLSSLVISGVRIVGGGRQTGVGLSLNGTVAGNAGVLLQQSFFGNLKSAVSYAISSNKTVITAVNVTISNCIDGFAPLSSTQSAGFDTMVVSGSDISTREPAVLVGSAQGVDLLVVENSNVASKAVSPMKIASGATTKIKIDRAALIDKSGRAFSVATQVYDNVAENALVLSLLLDTAAMPGRGMGFDFATVDTSSDTGNGTAASLPATPFITGAAAGDSSATVTWLKSAYAKSYILYYTAGETVDSTGSMIIDTGLTKTITGLAAGRNYTVAVRAVNGAGKSPLSSPVTVRPLAKPSAPTIASIAAADGAVTITWNAAPFAESYNLFFQKGSGVDGGSAKFTGVTSPKTVTGLTNGVQYAFAVSAVNGRGESDVSAVDTAVPMGTLGAPAIAAAAPGDGSVTLSWGPVAGAASYSVYYAAGTTAGKNDAKITGVTSPKTITNLANGTQYAFAISAAYGSVESALSPIALAAPQAPQQPPAPPANVAAAPGIGTVTVSWSAVAGATKYKVYYAAGTTVDKTAACFGDAVSPKNVSGLSNGTVYAFAVSAVNTAGESNLSQIATTMPVVIPGAPVISAALAGDSIVTVSWSPVALATSYNLYYAAGTTVDKTGLKLLSVTAPFTVKPLTNGTKYAFAVAAANASGESGLSDVKTATPGVPPPPAPTGVAAAPSDSAEVSVAWNPVGGASSYNIYYTQGTTVDTLGTKISAAASPLKIGQLTTGVPWAFCVTAVNAGGQSAISLIATATPTASSGAK